MSQDIFSSLNPATTSGIQLANLLNSFKDAYVSGNSGTSRPVETELGGTWIDTTDVLTGYLYLTLFDGTSDIRILTINTTTGTSSIGSSDSTFEIQKISNDDLAPVLSLFKRRIAGTGQALDGDALGKVRFQGYNNSSVKTEVAYFEIAMNEDLTNSTKGSTLRYLAAIDGSGSVSEVLRITNNKLGIGTLVPEAKVHINDEDALLVEQRLVDSNPVKFKVRKSRNGGQVLSMDDVFQLNINTIDDVAGDSTVASITAQTTEAHTATAKGTKLTISNSVTGAAGQSEAIVCGDFIDLKRKTLASEIQIGPTIDTDGNYRFYIVLGKLQLQKRVSAVWEIAQEWE